MDILEIVVFTLIGIALGIVSGLLPGIHVNTISAFILAILPTLSGFSTISIVIAIVSMAVVNSFLSFIPSILFGAPDSETVLSVLPGHRMLLNGEAIEAIKLTAIGGLISLIVVLSTFYVSIISIPTLHLFLRGSMHYLLIFVSLIGVLLEEKPISAAAIFLLSGIFGIITLNNFGNEVVFPALSGMFGISTLLLSLNPSINIPIQNKIAITLDRLSIIKNSLLGSFAGVIVGFLPGIGSAQATFLVQQLNAKQTEKEFLVSNSAVSVGNTLFPLFVLYAIGKTRSGVAIATKELLGGINFDLLILILIVALIAGIASYFLHIKIGSFLTNILINRKPENYKKISIAVIIFLIVLSLILTGFIGLLILLIGTLIGLLPQLLGVRRAECMGFFVLTTIIYYANF
ncbi:TPA: tripartite tricarboxylate transporter permease [archaeon]|uniref:Tripartite tricarboxylate transporter permease n=1 Tax=Candidatus Naiadarchaeum limnaeum TaxID=2756139 RepID=A0A832UZK7_9ARCH|nr:tripartite tricarboxylate transporter permease [Candidatus Naiadarchaeales archaeon SRR2090153.bin1042]HIK00214.1 tripartite tricarboxylate transporter permease [Candidatus Naiadarchaeum limnaeum]